MPLRPSAGPVPGLAGGGCGRWAPPGHGQRTGPAQAVTATPRPSGRHLLFEKRNLIMVTTPSTATGPDVLWQHLADALNALIDAGQFPDFHNLYGARNGWQYQPYATDDARADASWVVFDLATRRFTVSSRERTLSGEHSRRSRRTRG